jgi:hypothetical protein
LAGGVYARAAPRGTVDLGWSMQRKEFVMRGFRSMMVGTLAVGLLGVGTATAQDRAAVGEYGPIAGDWEFLLNAGGSNDRRFTSGGFNLNVEAGYYVTDEVLVSLRQNVNWADQPGSGSSSVLGTGVGVDYHFDFGQWRPFVGLTLGYVYGNAVRNSWAMGPEAGLKWYLDNNTFIVGRVNYEFLFRSAGDLDDNWDNGRFNYVVGIGLNF